MDLPSSRELDLEALLRKKDSQLAELTVGPLVQHCFSCLLNSPLGKCQDEVNTLRQYLSTQPNASLTEPLSLPPALISLLLTHIDAASAESGVRSSSSTVNTALAQRAKLLQEENDELYELLKSSETGKLKEEVRGLRRAVNRLETALRGE
jgi:WTAP/Mum2p family